MMIDRIIHDYHSSAESVKRLASFARNPDAAWELTAKASYEFQMARELNTAVRYWLDIKQVEHFRNVRFKNRGFPPLIHSSLFVEFNGLLEFDFCPWQRDDIIIAEDQDDSNPKLTALHPRPFNQRAQSFYKGVFIKRYDPPHIYARWPKDSYVVRVFWFERPDEIMVEDIAVPTLDNYAITFSPLSWPKIMDVYDVMADDERTHPGELRHQQRLFNATVNLLNFLAAENVVRIRIRPEDHARHPTRELSGLPKSERPYHVLPFQLPRYRYLYESGRPKGAPSGRSLSCSFDVIGHVRHLTHERYARDADGNVRTMWINGYRKGEGKPYRPAIRRGEISSLFLDYDKFIRDEERRVARRLAS